MAAISENNTNIQVEETQTKAAVGESMLQRIGGAINWHNNYDIKVMSFEAAGEFSSTGIANLKDIQSHTLFFNAQLCGCIMRIANVGLTGQTEIDIRIIRDATDIGSIFSTRPIISSNADNKAMVGTFINFSGLGGGVETFASTNGSKSIPVIGTTDLLQGDSLQLDFISTATESGNLELEIAYRARA